MIQLINSAYQDGMANIADGSVDLVLTDPPYGTTCIKWDQKIDLDEFWGHIRRVLKPTGVAVVFSAQPFTTDLIVSNRKAFRYEIIWEKTMAAGFFDCNIRPMRAHENLCVFIKEKPKSSIYNAQLTKGEPYIKTGKRNNRSKHYGNNHGIDFFNPGVRFPRSVNKFSNKNNFTFHPTQKPLDLIEWLVKTYSNEGDMIFDPFAGSATTAVACQNLNRSFIGFEREKEYYDKAMQRLADNEIFSQGLVCVQK